MKTCSKSFTNWRGTFCLKTLRSAVEKLLQSDESREALEDMLSEIGPKLSPEVSTADRMKGACYNTSRHCFTDREVILMNAKSKNQVILEAIIHMLWHRHWVDLFPQHGLAVCSVCDKTFAQIRRGVKPPDTDASGRYPRESNPESTVFNANGKPTFPKSHHK